MSLQNTFISAEERFLENIEEITISVIKNSILNMDIQAERLTQAEKLHIVNVLNQKGIFLLKGTVSQVAK